MKVLVVGNGGREHALCWKIAQSPLVTSLYCTPGNPGIGAVAECVAGDPLEVATQIKADFVVVGPEVPLAGGLVDKLQAAGIAAFGPSQQAAQLEASKAFCKALLKKYNIPTGAFEVFDDASAAKAYIAGQPEGPLVVKYDGLAAGKGVVVANSREEAAAAVDEWLRQPGDRVLVEECLTGPEVSLIALTDGESILPLVPAQDHKRIGEGDTGPNTGGMGCYSPVPAFGPELQAEAVSTILEPTLAALRAEGITYRGALYAGLMLTPDGPRVIEYNCRFGDPETQVILPRLQGDLLPLLLACAGQGPALKEHTANWTADTAVCVVMAAAGYPGTPRKGDAITGLDDAAATGAVVFHAGTSRYCHHIVASGGRVLGITALGDGFAAARANCYAAVDRIQFEGAQFRRDIGWRCL